MKISLTNIGDKNYITDYGENYICVNDIKYYNDVIVKPNEVIDNWDNYPAFSSDSLKFLISHDPEILIIGTGPDHVQISPSRMIKFTELHLPFEVMSSPAACRTFNILVAEDRKVMAAIVV